ncbi:three-deoxy-D-manno-octulosonic-acid transferase domain protein [Methylocaldum marinum]|uniref:3-deoxy-D-manno-octulosonic acid transferase n=1 Tax=Methylocaldum marinum TaxID=1432792 RepID=A0A250KPM4_9GAMM|nr:lipid IV(A) 3-deoxy-D-manno-octulosonic acid transferase [Methylocaldum marinum]BBA32931.1 three-deoxy-D-manno-octulosonic-acid transferase domain protein [Methylocaldum marinum]
MRRVYSALLYLITPVILGRLFWRGRKQPDYNRRWLERLAVYPSDPEPGVIWFHAVSVGEAEAAFPLIQAIKERFSGRTILVTATTPTGSARIRQVLGETARHVYLPYDLPTCADRFIRHFHPVLGVVLETEIWPNLYHACGQRGIPLAIVNGRLSEKSARGYHRLRSLASESLSNVRLIAAQTPEDAQRYLAIGADPKSVTVAGNIKFDTEFPSTVKVQAKVLRDTLFGSRPIFVAGSTHPGEESQILNAFMMLRGEFPELLLVLAPRHPHRSDDILAECKKIGFAVRRRSEDTACDESIDVFLLDTLGELRNFYAASDVAFVGGSLVSIGGHNVLEPALAGLPVLFGPHMFNFAEISRRLKECGGGIEVKNAEELVVWTGRLLADVGFRRETGEKGRRFVSSNQGAVRKIAGMLETLIDQP